MEVWGGVFLLTGLYPLFRVWRVLQGTTLRDALVWGGLAWFSQVAAWMSGGGIAARYLALALLACAGVAVLGARRPGMTAWNFVVLGLFTIFCLPFLQGFGELRLETPNLLFLAGALIVGIGNYLPTRNGPAAVLLGVFCALELASLWGRPWLEEAILPLVLGLVPWVAQWCHRAHRRAEAEYVRLEQSFRDAFGYLWAQRMSEQFHRAAEHAGINLPPTSEEEEQRALSLQRAVLRRFDRQASEE